MKGFCKFLWYIFLILSIYLVYLLLRLNLVPTKYFIIGIIILIVVLIITYLISHKLENAFIMTLLSIIIMLIICIFGFSVYKLRNLNTFFSVNFDQSNSTDIYYVLVNSNSSIEKLSDISENKIYFYKDENIDKAKDKIDSNNFEEKQDLQELFNIIENDLENVLLINSGFYQTYVDAVSDYESKVKIIDEIEINVKKEEIENDDINVLNNSYVVFINGIDTRSGSLPSRSLSDVNILMAVNPNTKKILMVHIPRDYYVVLPGKNAEDKLTHTGTIGGVSYTIDTIKENFDVDIDYYARVNFNMVINLVNAVGGITINSDVNYAFTCKTNSNCRFLPGENLDVDGECALAFARERYAYKDGDRHRGENQEQVITKVIEKVTSSKELLLSFDSIIESLNGTFETNMSYKDMSSIIKNQINENSKWEITSYNVDGDGAMKRTFSYPNMDLYVMIPNIDTINEAKSKIDSLLKEK